MTTANEYDSARDDYTKSVAALSIARRKATPDVAWQWATIACNHAIECGITNARSLLDTKAWPNLDNLDAALADLRKGEILIVTKHPGLVEWLRDKGYNGQVIERATPADVLGKHVVGVLPDQMRPLTASFTKVYIPNVPEDKYGKELSAAELHAQGAYLVTCVIRQIATLQP